MLALAWCCGPAPAPRRIWATPALCFLHRLRSRRAKSLLHRALDHALHGAARSLVHGLPVPDATFSTLTVMRLLISRAASPRAEPRERTSDATTAESPSLLTGPRGFHRRVQRQDVGLEKRCRQ